MNFIKRIFSRNQPKQIPDLGRNDLCWCGSGKKYKKCHFESDERKRAAMRAKIRTRCKCCRR